MLPQKTAMTWSQEFTKKSLTAPLVYLQENRKRIDLQVNRKFRSENTRATIEADQICWPFSSWQTTTILQISRAILTELPNCQNHLR